MSTPILDQNEALAHYESLILQAKEKQAAHLLKTGRNVPIPVSGGAIPADGTDILLSIEILELYICFPDKFAAKPAEKPSATKRCVASGAVARVAARVAANTAGTVATVAPAVTPAPETAAQPVKLNATDRARMAIAGKPVPPKPKKQTATDRARAALAKKTNP
jgi:hypothetical protein